MHYNSRWLLFHIDNQPFNDVSLLSSLNNVAIVNLPHNTMALDIPENLVSSRFFFQCINQLHFKAQVKTSGNSKPFVDKEHKTQRSKVKKSNRRKLYDQTSIHRKANIDNN